MADTKQQAFVEAYLRHFNATRAAVEAGYSEKTAYSQGHRLLKKAEIRALLESRLSAAAMSADEVLTRLSDMARADIGDFLDLDIQRLKRHPRSRLLKRVKRTIKTRVIGEVEETTEVIEIELHDPQAALVQLGRHHRLWIDRVQNEDWRSQAIEDIRAGRVDFETLAEAFDHETATDLFRAAGGAAPAESGPTKDGGEAG
jgi:hypothetical protein